MVEFGILGPLCVRVAGRELPLGSRKQRTLLALLLVDPGSAVSVDRAAEVLWGTDQPRDPSQAVHTHVSRLRGALEAAGGRGAREVLVTRPSGYALAVQAEQVDASRFERLAAEARAAGQPAAVVELVEQALGLWRGSAFAGFDEDFARPAAARLEELRTATVGRRIEAMLALGRHREAVAELEPLVSRHPLREGLWGQLMLALYRCGRQADALEAYRTLRDRLVDELGLEPSGALRELHQGILRQSAELAAPPGALPVDAVPARLSSEEGSRGTEPTGESPADLLPEELTSFVGRESEVDELVALLDSCRLVTLTGPGGVGKTRLALRVARRVAPDRPGGVVVADLATVDDAEAVGHVLATASGVLPEESGTADDAVVAFLRPRRVLLVVDNCEHVIDRVGALVQRIVRECREVTVLATSRQPLSVTGEQVWPVGPLGIEAPDGSPGPAVRLFRDRAAAADPSFRLTGDRRSAVVEICRRLDGLPLGIELAAARVRSMTPEDLAARLDDRFRLLTAGRRTGPAHHRTLGEVVDWSYDLLSDRERRLFERLSVFAHGFDLTTAELVCADEQVPRDEIAGLLADLVDHSLVVTDRSGSRTRYRLLETLRAYGRARLEQRGELVGWCARHAGHFVALAEEADEGLRGAEEARWVGVLDRELPELRAARRHALDTGDLDTGLRLAAALTFYAYLRMRDEILRWAEEMVTLPAPCEHPRYPAVCGTAAFGCINRGELGRARTYARRGREDDPADLYPLMALSDVALYEGRLEERTELGERVTALARAAGEPYLESLGCLQQGLGLAYTGRTDEALACAERGRALAQVTGNPTLTAWHLYLEAEVLLDAEPDRALVLLERAVVTAESVGNRFAAGVARVSAASLRARHGEPRRALTGFREVIEHWHQVGDWTHQWTTLRNLIVLFSRVGATGPAAVLYGAVATADSGAAAYGDDAERLEATALALRGASADFARDEARGRAMDPDEVVAYALEQIDRLLGGAVADTG